MHPRYLEAIVNSDGAHTLLGRRLHPYCLYDLLFLEIAGNPLRCGGEIRMEHLQEAALICSTPPEKLLRGELTPSTRFARLRFRLWHWISHRRFALATEFARWRAYTADYDQRPEWTEGEGKDDEPGRTPWIERIATVIEAHTNMARREIMTAPLGWILWKAADIASLFQYTREQILTEEEEEIIAAIRAHRATKAAAKAASAEPKEDATHG